MKLIIGLGNPGNEYAATRHNAGRMVLDAFRRSLRLPDFSKNEKYRALVTEGAVGKERIILLLPETMMNNSGYAVRAISAITKIKPAHTVVVHDDADILFGKMKLSFAKRAAGHRGVESVRRALKTHEFWRLRIGIQPSAKRHIPAMDLVLKKFSANDLKAFKKVEKAASNALSLFIEKGGDAAMTEFN